jgi:hypothetical protein
MVPAVSLDHITTNGGDDDAQNISMPHTQYSWRTPCPSVKTKGAGPKKSYYFTPDECCMLYSREKEIDPLEYSAFSLYKWTWGPPRVLLVSQRYRAKTDIHYWHVHTPPPHRTVPSLVPLADTDIRGGEPARAEQALTCAMKRSVRDNSLNNGTLASW